MFSKRVRPTFVIIICGFSASRTTPDGENTLRTCVCIWNLSDVLGADGSTDNMPSENNAKNTVFSLYKKKRIEVQLQFPIVLFPPSPTNQFDVNKAVVSQINLTLPFLVLR